MGLTKDVQYNLELLIKIKDRPILYSIERLSVKTVLVIVSSIERCGIFFIRSFTTGSWTKPHSIDVN